MIQIKTTAHNHQGKEEHRDAFQQGLATIKIANVLAERCDKHSVFQLLEIHKHINTQIHKYTTVAQVCDRHL